MVVGLSGLVGLLVLGHVLMTSQVRSFLTERDNAPALARPPPLIQRHRAMVAPETASSPNTAANSPIVQWPVAGGPGLNPDHAPYPVGWVSSCQ